MVRAGMSSLLQYILPLSLWREHSPIWVSLFKWTVRTTQGSCGLTKVLRCQVGEGLEALKQPGSFGGGGSYRPRQEQLMTASWHSESLCYPQGWASAFSQNPRNHGHIISWHLISLSLVSSCTVWFTSYVVCFPCAEPFRGGRPCSLRKTSLSGDSQFEFQPCHLLVSESVFLFCKRRFYSPLSQVLKRWNENIETVSRAESDTWVPKNGNNSSCYYYLLQR